jgi:hypothetical protein
MKIVENFFNALFISLAVALVFLGTLFIANGGNVEISERTPASNVTKPLMAMLDVKKEHHMFANDYVIIDISYNK